MNNQDLARWKHHTETALRFVEVIFLWFCFVGLIGTSYWSFDQTWKFVDDGNPGWQSLFLALGIQYAQNLFILGAIVWKDETTKFNNNISIRTRDVMILGFIVSFIIDAGTNIGEWRATNQILAQTLNVHSVTWQLLCVSAVFVEELLGRSFSLAMVETVKFFQMLGFNNEDLKDNKQPQTQQQKPQQQQQNKPPQQSPIPGINFGGQPPKRGVGRPPQNKPPQSQGGQFQGQKPQQSPVIIDGGGDIPDELKALLGGGK